MTDERIVDALLIVGALCVALGVLLLAGPAWALIALGTECLVAGVVLARQVDELAADSETLAG
jgi:hypothetical protein